MKKLFPRLYLAVGLLAFGLMFTRAASAQSGVVPAATPTPETAVQRPAPTQDPVTLLNLTPEQRQQIRAIRQESQPERAAINRRVRETKQALDSALDSEKPDEALIEQRVREASEARAASLRLQSLTAARIRRVLTPEQVQKLKELLLAAEQNRREQRLENRAEGRQNLPNQQNGILPGGRRNPLRRRP